MIKDIIQNGEINGDRWAVISDSGIGAVLMDGNVFLKAGYKTVFDFIDTVHKRINEKTGKAFSKIKIAGKTIVADSKEDTLSISTDGSMEIIPNTADDSIKIRVKGDRYYMSEVGSLSGNFDLKSAILDMPSGSYALYDVVDPSLPLGVANGVLEVVRAERYILCKIYSFESCSVNGRMFDQESNDWTTPNWN